VICFGIVLLDVEVNLRLAITGKSPAIEMAFFAPRAGRGDTIRASIGGRLEAWHGLKV